MYQVVEEFFEHVLEDYGKSPAIDLRDAGFIYPYGMVGLLEIGELCRSEGVRKSSAFLKQETF